MISVAALDPSSLTLWVDFTQISTSPAEKYIQELCAISLGPHPQKAGPYIAGISDLSVAKRCAQVVSSLWHEERHFLDLLLTNYGAFRVRQFFELYVNAGLILSNIRKDKVDLHCPLHVYADPVISRYRGIRCQNQNILTLAKAMKNRRATLNSDQFIVDSSVGPINVGGEAQLEALAAFFQTGSSQAHVGDPTLWQKDVANWKKSSRYRWAEYLGELMGVMPVLRSKSEDIAGADLSLLIPLLFSSLMMRAWGQRQNDSGYGTSGLPSDRLSGLMHSFEGFHFEFGELNINDAWNLVNQHAKQLWGRSIHEELLEDYDQEEKYCSRISQLDYVRPCIVKALNGYHNTRGKLIKLLKSNPEWFLDVNAFSTNLLPALNPILVNAVPCGVYGEPPIGTHLVYGYRHPDYQGEDGLWWWAVGHHSHGGVELADTEEWLDIASYYAPLAKIMMNGRRHKTMLGPEILSIQKRLEAAGISIKLDPLYVFPEREETIENLYYLQMRNTLTCDWCGKSVHKPSGRLISPWVFRLNSHNANLAIEAFGGGIHGELKFLKDWSFWVFCDDCASTIGNPF